jgi:hypothetical protein
MPRFYFDVRRAGVTDKDEEGVLLPIRLSPVPKPPAPLSTWCGMPCHRTPRT